ncbi:hypothetical protein KD33_07805 [Clostridium sp. NCR]|nr:hypothetical protein KD33_07805 [Clostridium sp. NCR]
MTDDSVDLYFYSDIVSSYWDSWDDTDQYPESIKNFLDEVGDKDLNIYINSGGGSVFAGIAIYNMLKRHKGYKTVYVDGVAASIASVIAMAGDKIIIPNNAWLMIHKPWVATYGNADELRQVSETLDKLQEGIINIYKEKLKDGVDISTIEEMVNKETWLTGEDAFKYFDIEISDSLEVFNKVESDYLNRFTEIPKELTENVKETENKVDEDEISNQLQIEKEKLMLELELI